MKSLSVLAIALVAGVAVSAGGVRALHAQAKPPVYVVIDIRAIKDMDAYHRVMAKATQESLKDFGGEYIIRTDQITGFDGAAPARFVVIAFDSAEEALAWRDSAFRKELSAERIKSTDSSSFMVEGLAD